jgi:hypothetical protein
MTSTLTVAEDMKLGLLAEGVSLTQDALDHIAAFNGDRALTPADYASTSGVILRLDGDVWVNAPISAFNNNFVTTPSYALQSGEGGLVVTGHGAAVSAEFWLQPTYHGQSNAAGEAYNSYVFTHTDRVRVSPIEGCAFTCTFCDLPYEFRYRSKSVDGLLDAINTALHDPVQPASHILISGGTPRPAEYAYVREVYEATITTFPDVAVDIMMVPLSEVLDIEWLASLGVAEVSINLEVWSDETARRVMPRKHKQGRQYYLDYLRHAAAILGGGRVRSMLMLGIEPLEDSLEGIEAIASLGCVPVLSPFRPDPSTPLRNWPAPSTKFLRSAYVRAREITTRYGVPLGPPCIPCAHNTLTMPATHGNGDAHSSFGEPRMI